MSLVSSINSLCDKLDALTEATDELMYLRIEAIRATNNAMHPAEIKPSPNWNDFRSGDPIYMSLREYFAVDDFSERESRFEAVYDLLCSLGVRNMNELNAEQGRAFIAGLGALKSKGMTEPHD